MFEQDQNFVECRLQYTFCKMLRIIFLFSINVMTSSHVFFPTLSFLLFPYKQKASDLLNSFQPCTIAICHIIFFYHVCKIVGGKNPPYAKMLIIDVYQFQVIYYTVALVKTNQLWL